MRGISPSRPLAPLAESPMPVYMVGIGIGVACAALVLLLFGALVL